MKITLSDKKLEVKFWILLFVVLTGVLLASSCKAEVPAKNPTYESVITDSLRARLVGGKIWLSDGRGDIAWLRMSGDSLYLGDATGEKSLGSLSSNGISAASHGLVINNDTVKYDGSNIYDDTFYGRYEELASNRFGGITSYIPLTGQPKTEITTPGNLATNYITIVIDTTGMYIDPAWLPDTSLWGDNHFITKGFADANYFGAGGGDVTVSGTPVANQLAVFTDSNTIRGVDKINLINYSTDTIVKIVSNNNGTASYTFSSSNVATSSSTSTGTAGYFTALSTGLPLWANSQQINSDIFKASHNNNIKFLIKKDTTKVENYLLVNGGSNISGGTTPTDGIWDWQTDKYGLYSSPQTTLSFSSSSSAPGTYSNELVSLNGKFKATSNDGNGITLQVATSGSNTTGIYAGGNPTRNIWSDAIDGIAGQFLSLHGTAIYSITSTSAPYNINMESGDTTTVLLRAYQGRNVFRLTQDSATFYNTVYIKSDLKADTCFLFKLPTGKVVSGDSVSAAFGLWMPLPSISDYISDSINGEIAWYYQDSKGNIVKQYGITNPYHALEQLQAMNEINLRYTAQLNDKLNVMWIVSLSIISLLITVIVFMFFKSCRNE